MVSEKELTVVELLRVFRLYADLRRDKYMFLKLSEGNKVDVIGVCGIYSHHECYLSPINTYRLYRYMFESVSGNQDIADNILKGKE